MALANSSSSSIDSSTGPLAISPSQSNSPALHVATTQREDDDDATKGLTIDDGLDFVDISRTNKNDNNHNGDAMDHRFKRFVSPDLVSTLLTGQVIIII